MPPMTRGIHLPPVSVSHRTFSVSIPAIDLHRGEILGVFGKSGSGKTTYLRNIREHFPSDRVHYMSQADCLLEESTIRQNIEIGLACSAQSRSESLQWETTHSKLLKDLEIDKHLHKLPRMMSGGQRKRAEIARCLMMDPDLLLLDEPFQGIGHIFEAVSSAYILGRSGRTDATIIVSHDFPLLCKFCDRVLLMDDQGVIGFVPTRDSSWRPVTHRAAWTLGVENIVPPGIQGIRSHLLDGTVSGTAVGCWATQARWTTHHPEGEKSVLEIDPTFITNSRTYLLHGIPYTQIDLGLSLELHARGMISTDARAFFAMDDHWSITA